MLSKPWVSNHTAQNVLVRVHFASPIILISYFLIAFLAHSILTAPKIVKIEPSTGQTGPGGKPLPKKVGKGKKEKPALSFSPARRQLFIWLSVGTILTLLGNAAVVILHALWERDQNWWCGESVAVRTAQTPEKSIPISNS